MILFVVFFTLTASYDKSGKHIYCWKFVQIFDIDAASSEYLINGEEGEMIDIPPKFRWINAASSQCNKTLDFLQVLKQKFLTATTYIKCVTFFRDWNNYQARRCLRTT